MKILNYCERNNTPVTQYTYFFDAQMNYNKHKFSAIIHSISNRRMNQWISYYISSLSINLTVCTEANNSSSAVFSVKCFILCGLTSCTPYSSFPGQL